MAGAVEGLTVAASEDHDLVMVEGQGSLLHPGYSGVTMGLLHGCRADSLILCHIAGLTHIEGYDVPIPPLPQIVALYEAAASWPRAGARIPVVGIALATFLLGEEEARRPLLVLRRRLACPWPTLCALEPILCSTRYWSGRMHLPSQAVSIWTIHNGVAFLPLLVGQCADGSDCAQLI